MASELNYFIQHILKEQIIESPCIPHVYTCKLRFQHLVSEATALSKVLARDRASRLLLVKIKAAETACELVHQNAEQS